MPIAKCLLVAEMEVADDRTAAHELGAALDRFRESACPSREYGITLYSATRADVDEIAASTLPPARWATEWIETDGRSLGEVAAALRARLRGVEFVVPGRSGGSAPWPSNARWIACYPVAGANEGHYVHVDAIHTPTRGPATVQQLLIIKVLTGRESALTIANACARALNAA